jgi:hypothetical protein
VKITTTASFSAFGAGETNFHRVSGTTYKREQMTSPDSKSVLTATPTVKELFALVRGLRMFAGTVEKLGGNSQQYRGLERI